MSAAGTAEDDIVARLRAGRLEVRLAPGAAGIDAAQALRYRVFYEEMDAAPSAELAALRTDVDAFDPVCDHLLVVDQESGGGEGAVVGTFRLLRRSAAEPRVGGAALTVQPVSIAYSRLGGLPMRRYMRARFAWYGDMRLAGHLWRMLGLGAATVAVEFHPPVTSETFGSRKALGAHCHEVIAAAVSAAVHGVPPRRGPAA